MSSLPEDLIEANILTRLPVKSISRFRCVSRNWHLLFRNPNFIKNHLNHANLMNNFNILVIHDPVLDDKYAAEDIEVPSIEEASLYSIHNNISLSLSPFSGHAVKIDYPFMCREYTPKIIGSSNGLVCIEPSFDNICIWNPATREYMQVPKAPIGVTDVRRCSIEYAFGFDCKNDDYKVLRIASFLNGGNVSEVRIYSLASDSWKNLGFIPYYVSFGTNDGLLLNGVLHWFATVCRSGINSRVVVCFDVSDETFLDVPLPCNISTENLFMSTLGIWEGKLCLLDRNHMEDPTICTHQKDHIDVWIMVDNKWSKHLKITAHMPDMHYGRLIETLQNGEILFEGGPIGADGVRLLSYDPNLDRARALKTHGFPDESDSMVNQTYVETLVPLDPVLMLDVDNNKEVKQEREERHNNE